MPRKPKDTPAPDATTPENDPYEGLSDDNHNDFAQQLIQDGFTLLDEKKALMEKIDKNRQALRLVVGTGHASEKQQKAAVILYPVRTKKDDDADAATVDAVTTDATTTNNNDAAA